MFYVSFFWAAVGLILLPLANAVFMWQQHSDLAYDQPFIDWLTDNEEVALVCGVGIFLSIVMLVIH